MTDGKDLSPELSHVLIAATKGMLKFIWEAEGWEGLTGPQFGIMAHLHRSGPLKPSELSERMSVTAGNMTGMVARLKKLGYVERRRLSTDRRCLRIALSAEGHRRVEKVLPIWSARVRECFRPLPRTAQKQLLALLTRLCTYLPASISPFQDKDRSA